MLVGIGNLSWISGKTHIETRRIRIGRSRQNITENHSKKRLHYKERSPSLLLHKSEYLIEILACLKIRMYYLMVFTLTIYDYNKIN